MSLWRHGDFVRLWAAQTVSSVGARITREGLPFAAVAGLGATPAQVGLLAALARGPALVVGLAAGGFVDRRRRRGVLIGADLARAATLATLPLAAAAHALTMMQLYLAAAGVGALGVLFDMADHAYLPTLIGKTNLVEGNSRLAATESLAEIGGPALYGLLFQAFTAPIAIAVNSATYLMSAAALATIRAREPPPAPAGRRARPGEDLRVGLARIGRDAMLRPLLAVIAAYGLFTGMFGALYMVFALRELRLTAAMLGATVALGGVAALAGAAACRSVTRRLGLGRAFVIMGLVSVAGSAFIPMAGGTPVAGMVMLMAAQLFGDGAGVICEIAGRTLRQERVEPELMGRVGGVFAAAAGGGAVAGALVGGELGQWIGVRPSLWIAVAGLFLSFAAALASPLARRSADGYSAAGGTTET